MNKNVKNFGESIDEEEDEDYNRQESINRKDVKQIGGFQNIVKRIQLVARLSKGNQHEDRYDEDEKLNLYLKQSKFSARRRSKRNSLLPTTAHNLSIIKESPFESTYDKLKDSHKSNYITGEITFLQKGHQYDMKPFVLLEQKIILRELAYIFKEEWELAIPKIVTLIVTGKSQSSRWKNEKQIKSFQMGIAKAAMSTNMWILTNGINSGVTSYVCSAIDSEFKKAKLKNLYKIENSFQLLGIAHENHLVYGKKLCKIENAQNMICIENTGYNDNNKFELNPDHSHFILLKNFTHKNDFILNLIDLFTNKEFGIIYNQQDNSKLIETPLVSILIEGEPENANLILNLIKKQIPVVILQGSGGMADIIAYAYTRILDSFADTTTTWDPDYIEEYIKPLLTKKIALQFVELANNFMVRNMVREQVIECVRISKQDGRQYLMLLDMHNINSCNLANLREYLLNALLKSRRNVDFSSHDQFLKDFDLIVDWNCASVAKKLLFSLNSVNITELLKSKFFNILIRRDREEFVEIFLSNGFQLHKFLTPSKLSRLFRIIHEDEFFHTVCWETALSKSSSAKQSKFFIENDLNWLLEFCTGLQNFVNTEELHLSSQGIYIDDSFSAERKALTLLSMWAIVQNRYELVEVLWKYSDHPVHLALIISMFFERLSWHVFDTNLKAELQQKSQKFGNYANGVLDRCYNENITLAYNVLRESIKEWNYMTAVDIAANARLKRFLAHPCCQKWLTNTFQGKIRLREITWGFFTIPISIKILLCSLLVFPMYIWVRFKNDETGENLKQSEIEEEFNVYDDMYTNIELKNISPDMVISFKNDVNANTEMAFTNKAFEDSFKSKGFINNRNYREVFVQKQPALWKMIYMMWCSPISKFYTSQLFYMIFLVMISLSALYPNCGCFVLDSVVCVWSLLIAISYIRHIYILFIKYSSISIYPKIIETLLILVFTIIFLITRVFKIYFYPIYWQKIIIAMALLYFYYRLISVYLPISATLGPFLYRFRLMITVDFINYMRITIVILIANTIAIKSLQYPYEDLSYESIRNVFYQGILSLFTGPPSGKINVMTDMNKHNQYCGIDNSNQDGIKTDFENDKNSTIIIEEDPFIIYVFVFQFFIILKLILGPLLFSIFAVTASKWVTEIDSIWKFQRYHLVIDFANRLAIPEPLSIFYYIYIVFYYLFSFCIKWTIFEKRPKKDLSQNIISSEDCMYWKVLASEYLDNEKRILEDSRIIQKEWDCIRDITEEIEYEKKVLREIKSKIFELEKFIHSTKNNNDKKLINNSSRLKSDLPSETPLSRLSPYPGTNINRYPLPRKFISWRIAFFAYEPVCYTKCKKEFHPSLLSFVDDDILKMKTELMKDNKQLFDKLPTYKWNDKEVDQNGILIDRQSWYEIEIKHDDDSFINQPMVYPLEDNFLPLNPFGRTGLRGKGQLLRWGPNHYCILIITQIAPNSKQTRILFEQKKQNELKLIERYINNQHEMYEFFKNFFNFSHKIQTSNDLDEAMNKHFEGVPLKFRQIQSGYLDDPSNTDNAWKEANVYLLIVEQDFQMTIKIGDQNLQQIWCDPNNEEQCLANLSLVDAQLISLVWDHFNL